eukprot:TRINITY_DN5079_c0_g3_i1.p1 TRINITY_DN5079_c0_g3~~TRINITY_DN5079_c0_g3_i1.p1  ORF type:complete len:320 (+),score=51.71 TRINITY_DN5079_c0_g3_i1:54-1013(+)
MFHRTARALAIGRIQGLVCPPFTPYKPDGSVNLDLIGKQFEMIEKTGASAIFLGGTASEGASQSVAERNDIAAAYIAEIKKKNSPIKLIQHVGATSLVESQELAKVAQEAGVDAIASVTPTFFKPANLNQMVSWLGEVAAAAPDTPFYYYHIPVMTGVPLTISVKSFLEAADTKIPSLHGLKYTSQNLCEYADCVLACDRKFDVMAGLSEQMLAALAMGAKSSVSVPFNLPFAMKYYQKILEQYKNGDLAGALETQTHINQLTFLLQHGGHGHPVAVMRAMVHMETGLDFGACRLPLTPISADTYKTVEGKLKSLGFLA